MKTISQSRFVGLLFVGALFIAPSTIVADDDLYLESSMKSLEHDRYKWALLYLRYISGCDPSCQYLRAIVSAHYRDREETQRLAQTLMDAPDTPEPIKRDAKTLLDWATDARIASETGKRIVSRQTVSPTLNECTMDGAKIAAWKQEWEALDIDPDSLAGHNYGDRCLGSPIVYKETYRARCESDARRTSRNNFVQYRLELGEPSHPHGWGYSEHFPAYYDGWGSEGDGYISTGDSGLDLGGPEPKPEIAIRESGTPYLACSVFAPPALDWKKAIVGDDAEANVVSPA